MMSKINIVTVRSMKHSYYVGFDFKEDLPLTLLEYSFKEAIDNNIARIKECLLQNNILYNDFCDMGVTLHNGFNKRHCFKLDGILYYYDEINNKIHQ